MSKYKQYDLITFEDDEQILCLSSYKYGDSEYILVCDYNDGVPSKSIYIMKSIEEDVALQRLSDKALELKLLKHFRSSLLSD